MTDAIVPTGMVDEPVVAAGERRKKGFLRLFIERNKVGMLGYLVFVLILLIAFVGPFFLPDKNPTDVSKIYQPPTKEHWLGTDFSGKDVLYMVVNGGRTLLIVSALAAIGSTTIAVVFGALAALFGGFFNTVVLTLADVFLTVPSIILLGVMAVFVRLDNILLLAFILMIFAWPTLLLAVRAQVLSLKEREYVEAARMLDLPTRHLLFREVLPNMMPYIVINFVIAMTGAIYAQVILYYLGLVPLQGDNWGLMIQQAYTKGALFYKDSIVYLLAPMFMIIMLQLSLVMISRTLEDVFNPRLREV
jgi:peptide/nickel transport system permease protein